jgi:hypothetical protein
MSEKSILEQALLQVNTLEEAVKQNAKGILSSVMKQELNDLLKESMEEEEEVAEQPSKEEETDDMSDAESDDDAEENDDMASINDEPSKDIDGEDEEAEDEDSETEAEDDFPTFDDAEEPSMDDDMLDMTNASDEEVLKVFKAMSDEDGIIVKKDGANISLKDEEDEYIIKLDEEDLSSEDMSEEDMDMDSSGDEEVAEEEESDEAIYEIELDGMEGEEMGDEEMYEVSGTPDDLELPEEEVEVDEAAHTKWNAHGGDRAGLPTKKMFAAGAKKTTNESAAQKKAINEEVQNLKKQNAEYKKALVLFKEKLNEVAVFNANLAYATRLFTEHSTTKSEKLNILKRFDSISTITESKNLYNSINAELGTKKPVTESVAEKISSTPSSSSSEVLSESKVYEAPQFARMKDLMKKIK